MNFSMQSQQHVLIGIFGQRHVMNCSNCSQLRSPTCWVQSEKPTATRSIFEPWSNEIEPQEDPFVRAGVRAPLRSPCIYEAASPTNYSCGQVRSHYSHNTISRAATGLNMVAKKYYRSNFQCTSYWNDICVMRGIFQKRGFRILLLGKNTRKYDKHILRTPSDWHAGSNTVSDASFS